MTVGGSGGRGGQADGRAGKGGWQIKRAVIYVHRLEDSNAVQDVSLYSSEIESDSVMAIWICVCVCACIEYSFLLAHDHVHLFLSMLSRPGDRLQSHCSNDANPIQSKHN